MPLVGTLRDLSLFNLVQLHCSERQRARVTLAHASLEGTLVFADGELVFAAMGPVTGEEAVHAMLAWEDGDFRVDDDPERTERNVTTPWSVLLLEGMRRLDEARAEHDTRLEASLRSMQGTHGLCATIVASLTGQPRAAATTAPASAEAALIAFLAGRLEAAGASLHSGVPREIVLSGPTEALWIARKDNAHVACWLEGRGSLNAVKGLVEPLLSVGRLEARRNTADEAAHGH